MTSPATAATPLESLPSAGRAWGRIMAIATRHYYLLLNSKARLMELFYWPVINLLTWGYLNQYLFLNRATPVVSFGVLLAGTLLWEMLQRSQVSVMLGTVEEMWSRNMMQLFVSPLKPLEFLAGTMVVSLARTTAAIAVCALLAFSLFGFSIIDLGLPFLGFYFLQIMTGWWVAVLLAAMLIRFGLGVEWLAWMAGIIIIPIAGAYYPVSVLPEWLQKISWSLPPTYIFEGMRQILLQGQADHRLLLISLALNLLYLAGSCLIFLLAFRSAQKHGSLMQSGE